MKSHNSVILANCDCMNIAYLLRNEAILIIFLVNIWGSLGSVIDAETVLFFSFQASLDLLSFPVISRDSSEHLKCISELKDKEIRCLAVIAEP